MIELNTLTFIHFLNNLIFCLHASVGLSCMYISILRFLFSKYKTIYNKAIAMIRRKSSRSENIYLIENDCQANISK